LNRKLLILDVVLAGSVVFAGVQLHDRWVAAKARQAQIPATSLKPAPPPPIAPLPQDPAVLPSGYKAIALNTLFDPSRNPDIPVDPPPPPPPDPVPPPMPSFHGSMDIGQGPMALLTPDGETHYQEVPLGGMIGPFKLVSFTRQEMELEWNGKILHKRKDDPKAAAAKSAGRGPKVEPLNTVGIVPGQAPDPATAPTPSNQRNELGPGDTLTDTVKACQPGDTTPAGAVADGFRKELRPMPIGGPQCVWRAIGK
jgi:hypothetical protein